MPAHPHRIEGQVDNSDELGHLLLTVEQAAQRLGIGRSLMYELLAEGTIESVHVGRLRRIPPDALTAFVTQLRAASVQQIR
jgi:excisionase family DNA binding protein